MVFFSLSHTRLWFKMKTVITQFQRIIFAPYCVAYSLKMFSQQKYVVVFNTKLLVWPRSNDKQRRCKLWHMDVSILWVFVELPSVSMAGGAAARGASVFQLCMRTHLTKDLFTWCSKHFVRRMRADLPRAVCLQAGRSRAFQLATCDIITLPLLQPLMQGLVTLLYGMKGESG